jgi:hypothetical protein
MMTARHEREASHTKAAPDRRRAAWVDLSVTTARTRRWS